MNAARKSGGAAEREVFADGNMSEVVRHGDTVERGLGPWSAASHAVLTHLAGVGFRGAPRLLGIVGDRELLTFVEGTSAPADLAGFLDDDHLVAVGSLVRELHSALASFTPTPELVFPQMPGAPEGAGFVCHNDLAPWNTVFQHGQPHAFIDWDLVAPAPPEWDLAYAAWRFVPLYPDDTRFSTAAQRGRRLRLLLDTYEMNTETRRGFIALIRQRQVCAFETVEQWGRAGVPGFARLFEGRLHAGALDDIAWLDANAWDLQTTLTS